MKLSSDDEETRRRKTALFSTNSAPHHQFLVLSSADMNYYNTIKNLMSNSLPFLLKYCCFDTLQRRKPTY